MGAMLRGLLVTKFIWDLVLVLFKIEPPGIGITFLYYFACTNLIVFFIGFTQGARLGIEQSLLYQLGLGVSVVTGILGATFNRSVTVTAVYKKSRVFEKNIQEVLTDLGFTATSELEGFTIYKIPSVKSLFVGKVFVEIDKRSATIICRSSLAKEIKNNEKLQEYF